MFNWKYDGLSTDYSGAPPMPDVKTARDDIRPDYSVGVNNMGGATLVLNNDTVTMTMSMTAVGTRQLIKLLQATLSKNEEEDA
jgi:hypothetical protein